MQCELYFHFTRECSWHSLSLLVDIVLWLSSASLDKIWNKRLTSFIQEWKKECLRHLGLDLRALIPSSTLTVWLSMSSDPFLSPPVWIPILELPLSEDLISSSGLTLRYIRLKSLMISKWYPSWLVKALPQNDDILEKNEEDKNNATAHPDVQSRDIADLGCVLSDSPKHGGQGEQRGHGHPSPAGDRLRRKEEGQPGDNYKQSCTQETQHLVTYHQ